MDSDVESLNSSQSGSDPEEVVAIESENEYEQSISDEELEDDDCDEAIAELGKDVEDINDDDEEEGEEDIEVEGGEDVIDVDEEMDDSASDKTNENAHKVSGIVSEEKEDDDDEEEEEEEDTVEIDDKGGKSETGQESRKHGKTTDSFDDDGEDDIIDVEEEAEDSSKSHGKAVERKKHDDVASADAVSFDDKKTNNDEEKDDEDVVDLLSDDDISENADSSDSDVIEVGQTKRTVPATEKVTGGQMKQTVPATEKVADGQTKQTVPAKSRLSPKKVQNQARHRKQDLSNISKNSGTPIFAGPKPGASGKVSKPASGSFATPPKNVPTLNKTRPPVNLFNPVRTPLPPNPRHRPPAPYTAVRQPVPTASTSLLQRLPARPSGPTYVLTTDATGKMVLVPVNLPPGHKRQPLDLAGKSLQIVRPDGTRLPFVPTAQQATRFMNFNSASPVYGNPFPKPKSSLEMIKSCEWDLKMNNFGMYKRQLRPGAKLAPTAQFLHDLGSDIVKQAVYSELINAQTGKGDEALTEKEKKDLNKLKEIEQFLAERLADLKLKLMECEFCDFVTDSTNALFLHKQSPHYEGRYLLCTFCTSTFSHVIDFSNHMARGHEIQPKIVNPVRNLNCPLCPYEARYTQSLANHKIKCEKTFSLDRNLHPFSVSCKDINFCLEESFYAPPVKITVPASQPVNQRNIQPTPEVRDELRKKALQNSQTTVPSTIAAGHPTALSALNARITPQENLGTIVTKAPIYSQLPPPPQVHPASRQLPPPVPSQPPPQTLPLPLSGHQQAPPPPPLQHKSVRPAPLPPLPKPPMIKFVPTQDKKEKKTEKKLNENTDPLFYVKFCEMCGASLGTPDRKQLHFLTVHDIHLELSVFLKKEPPFCCTTCGVRCWTVQGYNKHLTMHRRKEKYKYSSFSCSVCGLAVLNIWEHMSKVHKHDINDHLFHKKCTFCRHVFPPNLKDKDPFIKHMIFCHSNLYSYGDPSDLEVEVKQQSRQEATIDLTKDKEKKEEEDIDIVCPDKVSSCRLCNRVLLNPAEMTDHCLSSHFPCTICGIVLKNSANLKDHVCSSIPSWVRTCRVCNVKLHPAFYKPHMKKNHPDEYTESEEESEVMQQDENTASGSVRKDDSDNIFNDNNDDDTNILLDSDNMTQGDKDDGGKKDDLCCEDKEGTTPTAENGGKEKDRNHDEKEVPTTAKDKNTENDVHHGKLEDASPMLEDDTSANKDAESDTAEHEKSADESMEVDSPSENKIEDNNEMPLDSKNKTEEDDKMPSDSKDNKAVENDKMPLESKDNKTEVNDKVPLDSKDENSSKDVTVLSKLAADNEQSLKPSHIDKDIEDSDGCDDDNQKKENSNEAEVKSGTESIPRPYVSPHDDPQGSVKTCSDSTHVCLDSDNSDDNDDEEEREHEDQTDEKCLTESISRQSKQFFSTDNKTEHDAVSELMSDVNSSDNGKPAQDSKKRLDKPDETLLLSEDSSSNQSSVMISGDSTLQHLGKMNDFSSTAGTSSHSVEHVSNSTSTSSKSSDVELVDETSSSSGNIMSESSSVTDYGDAKISGFEQLAEKIVSDFDMKDAIPTAATGTLQTDEGTPSPADDVVGPSGDSASRIVGLSGNNLVETRKRPHDGSNDGDIDVGSQAKKFKSTD